MSRLSLAAMLHPKWKRIRALGNSEQLATDDVGMQRFRTERARNHFLTYLPISPHFSDLEVYHRQYEFMDDRETDTSKVWNEYKSDTHGEGHSLMAVDWFEHSGLPHSAVKTGSRGSYYMYQEKTAKLKPTLLPASSAETTGNDFWFVAEVSLADPANTEAFWGFSEAGGDMTPEYQLGFYTPGDSNQVYFRCIGSKGTTDFELSALNVVDGAGEDAHFFRPLEMSAAVTYKLAFQFQAVSNLGGNRQFTVDSSLQFGEFRLYCDDYDQPLNVLLQEGFQVDQEPESYVASKTLYVYNEIYFNNPYTLTFYINNPLGDSSKFMYLNRLKYLIPVP